MTTKNQPVQKIRFGRVTATVWANETENGTRYRVAIVKTYRTADNQYADTTSFDLGDLPLVEKAADAACRFIHATLSASGGAVG